MKLYLIRHGETDKNRKKELQGQSDFPLNQRGREMAVLTAQGMREISFDLIFTSPLSRARETAEIIRADREIPLILEPRIQEISFGIYEGLCYHKDHYNIPDSDFMNFFRCPDKYHAPEGGESLEKLIARTGAFLHEVIENKAYDDKTILISTHGCALRALMANLRSVPLAEYWGGGVQKNCAVTIVDVQNGTAHIVEEGKIFYEMAEDLSQE